jgi:hypothetical protein
MIGTHKILVVVPVNPPCGISKSFSKTSKMVRTQVRDRYAQNTSESACRNSCGISVSTDTLIGP